MIEGNTVTLVQKFADDQVFVGYDAFNGRYHFFACKIIRCNTGKGFLQKCCGNIKQNNIRFGYQFFKVC